MKSLPDSEKRRRDRAFIFAVVFGKKIQDLCASKDLWLRNAGNSE